ncbi:YbaK/EbsC family protein [Erysipelotrichaceae bacterium OttesenSCG-928-M19]|nr:YbaK/EbsC family protein [Erysipelotrichaceae bacterium OttesenSCG-928-M19]
MGIKEVELFFDKFNKKDDIIHVPDSSATVALAAQSLGVEEARIAKSLTFINKEDVFMVVMAGDVKIDNRLYKDHFKAKAKMLDAQQVLEHTGHEVGGVCPFALKNPQMKVYLDESLKRFTTVFPACGSMNTAIELSIAELEKYSNFSEWLAITK